MVCLAPKDRVSANSNHGQLSKILLCIDLLKVDTGWIGGTEYKSRVVASLVDGTSYEMHGNSTALYTRLYCQPWNGRRHMELRCQFCADYWLSR
jgi:hypothetical protein